MAQEVTHGLKMHSLLAKALLLLRLLVEFDPCRGARLKFAAGLTLAAGLMVLASIGENPYDFSQLKTRGMLPDGQTLLTIELAANYAFCGKYSAVYARSPTIAAPTDNAKPAHNLRQLITLNPNAVTVPLRTLIEREFGPLETYCAGPMTPFLNNENGLFSFYASILRLNQNASLQTLAVVVTTARLIIIGFIVFVLVNLGTGLLWCYLLALAAIKVHLTTIGTHVLANYPFMAFHLVFFCAAIALGYGCGAKRQWPFRSRIAFGANIGIMLFAIYSVRTSHGMAAMAIAVTLFGLMLFSKGGAAILSRKSVGIISVVCVLSGVLAYQTAFGSLPTTNYRYSYHAIAHPLVLGLAIPPNALAAREGIEWKDSIGVRLAQRIDPATSYLGPTYERALFAYYFGLWRNHPGEMMAVYVAKFNFATSQIPYWVSANIGFFAMKLSAPLRFLMRSGWIWLAFLTAVVVGASRRYLRTDSHSALFIALAAMAGVLLTFEHAIIHPAFNPNHFGSILFMGFVASLAIYQGLANATIALLEKLSGDRWPKRGEPERG